MKYSSIIILVLAFTISFVESKRPKKCVNKNCAGGGGDSYFRTLDGTLYGFNGECDLVMVDSPSYSSGLGLELHARTKIVNDWSLISNVALRIGGDILEISNDGSHYINGIMNVELPLIMAGQYLVTKGEDMISTFGEDGISQNVAQQVYKIHLTDDDQTLIAIFRSKITVNFDGSFEGTHGMLGTSGVNGLIGRDGMTLYEDPKLMGMDWQVNGDLDEPMLFHEVGGTQYPERCILKTASPILRKHSDAFLRLATEKCANAPTDLQALCFQFLLQTGGANIAFGYTF